MTVVTPEQAANVVRAIKEGATDYEGLANDIFTAAEVVELRTFMMGITPPSKGALAEGRKTLVKSGRLRDSVTGRFPESIRRVEGNVLTFGTDVPYASIHEFGGVRVESRTSAFGKPTMPYTWIAHYPQREFLGRIREPENMELINQRIVQFIQRRAQQAAGGGA